jgi:hypothetical protein
MWPTTVAWLSAEEEPRMKHPGSLPLSYGLRLSVEGRLWIPLAGGTDSTVDGMSAEEVYVYTRLAADKVGATKTDHPEDVEPHPLAATGGVDRPQRIMARAQDESG